MTTGAIYRNFKNRDGLFIALAQTYWAPIVPQVKPGSGLAEVVRAIADATIAAIPDREVVAVGRLSGLAYTVAHRETLPQVRDLTAQSYASGAQWLRSVTRKGELPMPAERLIPIIHALMLQRLLTPELVPVEIIRARISDAGEEPRNLRNR